MIRSRLLDAMESHDALTANAAVTHSTTSNRVVDLFFAIGALRGRSEQEIRAIFNDAWQENPLDALKVLFWARDIRKGQGERRTFRIIIKDLAVNDTNKLRPNLGLIPFFGRWDDMLEFFGTPLEEEALDLISSALREGDGLACKWAPRAKSSKFIAAEKIRKHLGLTPKRYRKMLVAGTKVVETQMCSGNWDKIQYDHVPSRAMMIYRKAFGRHSQDKFVQFLEAVKSGEKKIKAGTLYPYDIVRNIWDNRGGGYAYHYGNVSLSEQEVTVLDEQWKALPNYFGNDMTSVLSIVDVSGSMYSGAGSLAPILASLSLGIYTAERSQGAFNNYFMTFSANPQLVRLQGRTIKDKVDNLAKADWGMNTNLQASFDLILNKAIRGRIPQEEMPQVLVIFSDMEFDRCAQKTNYEVMRDKYARAGYQMPQLVFWNLNASGKNCPVKFNQDGVALVSGFSPSTMEAILGGEFTPISIMRKVIDSERYSSISFS